MNKWFSYNQQTQRTEEVVPTEELFQTSSLLFWTRGMSEWEFGPKALEFFLTPKAPIPPPHVANQVVEEKKQKVGPFYSKEMSQTPVVAKEPAIEVSKIDPIKPLPNKVTKKAVVKPTKLGKKKSKHILVTKKKKKDKNKKKADKLKKKKNRKNKKR